MLENKLFETLFDIIPFGVYVADVEDFSIVYMNLYFKNKFKDGENKKCHELIYGLDEPCYFCRNKELLSENNIPNGRTIIFEHFNDNDDKWYQLQEKTISWPNGRTVKYSIGVDITAQREVQNRLAEAHALLALQSKELSYYNEELIQKIEEEKLKRFKERQEFQLFEDKFNEMQLLVNAGLWRWNLKEGLFYWSDGLVKLYGYEKNDVAYTIDFFLSTFPKESSKMIKESIDKAIKDKNIFDLEHEFIRKDGTIGVIRSKGKATFDKLGEILEVFGVCQDITNQKEMEAKQKEQENVIIQQNKLATLGEIIGMISHQWKQPLTSISLLLDNLEDMALEDELDSEIVLTTTQKIKKNSAFLLQTMNDFQNFFKPSISKSKFCLKSSILEVTSFLEKQFSVLGVEIVVHVDEQINIVGFKNEFKHSILNILTNAKDVIVERSIQNPVIIISAVVLNNSVILTIEDNAGGIVEDLLPNKLFQLYITTKGEKGTGIGLNMVKTIIENKFNGKVSVTNTDIGAKFEIVIPIQEI